MKYNIDICQDTCYNEDTGVPYSLTSVLIILIIIQGHMSIKKIIKKRTPVIVLLQNSQPVQIEFGVLLKYLGCLKIIGVFYCLTVIQLGQLHFDDTVRVEKSRNVCLRLDVFKPISLRPSMLTVIVRLKSLVPCSVTMTSIKVSEVCSFADYVMELTANMLCKYGKYGLFEHFSSCYIVA